MVLGAQGVRKGAKMEPKVMKKMDWRHLVEHAKTMAGTVREPYGEVPGRVQETLFSERGAKATLEGSRTPLQLWESPGAPFWEKKRVF